MSIEKKWFTIINTKVTYREGELHISFAYRDKTARDRRYENLRKKAEIIKRTDFEVEFVKAIITVEVE